MTTNQSTVVWMRFSFHSSEITSLKSAESVNKNTFKPVLSNHQRESKNKFDSDKCSFNPTALRMAKTPLSFAHSVQ